MVCNHVMDCDLLRAEMPGRRIDWHAVLGSTMTEASRLAEAGAPSGTVVGAEEQTAGLGRRGRTWHSEPGSGLYVSVILRHQFAPATFAVAAGSSYSNGRCNDWALMNAAQAVFLR